MKNQVVQITVALKKSAMMVIAQNPNQQQHNIAVARSGTNCADYITLIRMHTDKQ